MCAEWWRRTAGGRDAARGVFLRALHRTPACINLTNMGESGWFDCASRALDAAAPGLLQAKSRKTTLEELPGLFLKFREGK